MNRTAFEVADGLIRDTARSADKLAASLLILGIAGKALDRREEAKLERTQRPPETAYDLKILICDRSIERDWRRMSYRSRENESPIKLGENLFGIYDHYLGWGLFNSVRAEIVYKYGFVRIKTHRSVIDYVEDAGPAFTRTVVDRSGTAELMWKVSDAPTYLKLGGRYLFAFCGQPRTIRY